MVKRAVEMEGTVTVSLPNYLNSDYVQLADESVRANTVLAW